MKSWWRRWSYEIPLAIGNALWDVLVVQFAAFLDRLTIRKIIAFIPVAILIGAYYHRIPIPPELMLVGDFLAYIDIFSVLFLLGVLSRVATIVFLAKQAAARITITVARLPAPLQRFDVRHRRQGGAAIKPRRKPVPSDEDRALGAAWGQAAFV